MPAFLNGIKYIHDSAGSQAKSPGVSWPHPNATLRACRVSPWRQQPCQLCQSRTMPSLSAKSIRQDPCQVKKIFYWATFAWGQLTWGLQTLGTWGLLTPAMSQSVRGQENIMLTCTVTMREHYIKTSFPASELRLPLMEIDSRTIIYNHYNRLDTMYSSVYDNYRRTQRKWT